MRREHFKRPTFYDHFKLNERKTVYGGGKKNFAVKLSEEPSYENTIYHDKTASPIRAIAEYEEMGGVVISYVGTISQPTGHIQLPPSPPRTFGIPDKLIIQMQQADTKHPVHIFIMCADLDEKAKIIKTLSETAKKERLHFNPKLLHLVPWDTDTYWTRDFAPWWVKYKNNNQYAISKHIYTTLGGGSVGLVEGSEDVPIGEGAGIFRVNDDYGAVKLSDFLNAPIRKWNRAQWSTGEKLQRINPHDWFFSGMLNVGGNYMVTSTGVIASSYLVAMQNELPVPNPKDSELPSPKEVSKRMKYIMEQTNRFLGANTYHVLVDPMETYIGHIDCWGKFLSDTKILLGRSPDEMINQKLDQIEQYFNNLKFQVYRVKCPNIYVPEEPFTPATTAPYTNSLILNDHVYVPIAGRKEYKESDEEALAVYKEALPNYTIVGVPGKPETPWLGTDALHCRTNTIPRQVVDNWLESSGMKE